MSSGSRKVALGCLAVIVAVVAAILVTALWIVPSLRKSYSIEDVSIRAAVRADGGLVVSERYSYDFNGSYTRVYRDIPYVPGPGHAIAVTGVSGPDGPMKRLPSGWTPAFGGPSVTNPEADATPSPWSSTAPEQRPFGYYRVTYAFASYGPVVRVEAFADLQDRAATFAFEWRSEGAAERFADTGELWWQLVGRGWEVPMKRVSAVVTLPPGATNDEVRAWGHGPLKGVVGIAEDASVTLTVEDLPEATAMEAHVLFPTELLADADVIPIEVLSERLADEAAWAEQANEERELAQAQLEAQRRNDIIAWAISGLAAAVAAAVWLWYFVRVGREYRSQFRAQYLREIPEGMPPALVGALWRMGLVTNDDIAATLLDLAVKGVLRIEDAGRLGGTAAAGASGGAAATPVPVSPSTKPNFKLVVRRDRLSAADDLALSLVTFLFDVVAEGDELTMRDMESWAEDHPARFRGAIEGWRARVEGRARDLGFVEKEGRSRVVRVAAVAGVAAAVTWVVFVVRQDWWLLAPFFACLALAVSSPVMRRRSREAAELHARYRALYHYLRDFGRLHEKPPTAVVLWEQYLVLALVFGIADEVAEQMRVHVPEVVADPGFRNVYWFAVPDRAAEFGGVSSAFSSFSHGVSAAVVAASPRSSSSGGGGGFSGGGSSGGSGGSSGGGGGGGGGGGAD